MQVGHRSRVSCKKEIFFVSHLDRAHEGDVLPLDDLQVRVGGGDLRAAGELPRRQRRHLLAYEPRRAAALWRPRQGAAAEPGAQAQQVAVAVPAVAVEGQVPVWGTEKKEGN